MTEGADMTRFAWIGSRLAAAVSGAFAAGLIAGVILTVVWAATCGSTCGNFLGGLFVAAIWASMSAIALGTLPGIATLTLTPARKHPWRSLLVLVPATVAGFAIWLLLQDLFHGTYGTQWLITLFLLPTTAGLIAAWNIEKLPRRLGLA